MFYETCWTNLRHARAADHHRCLDAGFLQGCVVVDPVFEAVCAFTRLTEEDRLGRHV